MLLARKLFAKLHPKCYTQFKMYSFRTFLLRIIGYYEKNNGSAGGALQNRIIDPK